MTYTPDVDTHAHVFDRTCRLVAGRRYTPGYDATTAGYMAVLGQAGLRRGVLVQPSFLGTDNGYLLAGLAQYPDRLRGVTVVAPDVTDATLEAMAAAGVRGIRYNLIGHDPGMIADPNYRTLTRRAAALGWLVEVQANGADLPSVLDTLEGDAGTVVVDHFGRPGTADPEADPGFRRLAASGRDGSIRVKLSAPYRLGGIDPAPYAAAFLERLGPERLLWGSDWPWTQNEAATSYGECVGQIGGWLGSAENRARFDRANLTLYGF